jgi:hypothetical protein
MKVTDLPIELAQIVTEKLLAANAGNATSVCSDLQAWCRTHPVACKDDNMWRLAFEALFIATLPPAPPNPPPVPDKPTKSDFGLPGPPPRPPRPPPTDSDSPADSESDSDDDGPSPPRPAASSFWHEFREAKRRHEEAKRLEDEALLSPEEKAERARHREKMARYNKAMDAYHDASKKWRKAVVEIQRHAAKVAAAAAKRAALTANPPASYRDAFTNVCRRIDQVRNGNYNAIQNVRPALRRSETFMQNVAAVDARILDYALGFDRDATEKMFQEALVANPRNAQHVYSYSQPDYDGSVYGNIQDDDLKEAVWDNPEILDYLHQDRDVDLDLDELMDHLMDDRPLALQHVEKYKNRHL